MTMSPAASPEILSTPVISPISPTLPNQPPLQTFPEPFIATEQTPQAGEARNRVFNYYFLFLALLAAMLAALLWWLHRQRRRDQEQIRLTGQRALERDVERWAIHRRRQAPVVEGLDHDGEAPPPYKPKDDTVTTLEHLHDGMDGAGSVAIPPRVLSREDTDHIRLPDYSETVRLNDRNTDRPPARAPDGISPSREGAT